MDNTGKLQRRKFFIPNISRFLLNLLIYYLFPSVVGNSMYYLSVITLGFSAFWVILELFVFLDYKKYPLIIYFPFLFDMSVISVLCYISGSINSPFIFLYLMMVISDTIYSDSRIGFHALIASLFCYSAISFLTYLGILEYINILDYKKNHHWIVYVAFCIFFIFSTSMMHFSIQEVMNQKKDLLGSLESERNKLQLSQKEIATLNKISKSVNDSSAIEQIMTVIADYVNIEYGIDICALYMVNERSKTIVNFYYKFPDEISKETLSKIEAVNFPLDSLENVHSHVYHTKKNAYTKVLTASKDEGENFISSTVGFTSFLCMPLILNQKVIGFLDFTISTRPMILTETELNSFNKLSNQIAGAIFNSNLLLENEKARTQSEIEKGIALFAQKETQIEKEKSDSLLLNILPEEIALELKESGHSKPVFYNSATVLFTDFQGFTEMAETLEPSKLISDLDYCFSKFDHLMEKFNLEKLKTIGDSYMCAGGIPKVNKTHAVDCVLAALGMQMVMINWRTEKAQSSEKFWTLRIGIHTGPLIAGVIGQKKFAYDVWGDTVNLASRMESSGLAQRVNISGDTYNSVKDFFDCEYRGKIPAKNKGEIDMYLVNGIKTELCTNEGEPNTLFWIKYDKWNSLIT